MTSLEDLLIPREFLPDHPNDVRSVHVSTTLAWYPNLTQRCLSQFINRRSVNEMLISHDDAYYESRKPKPDLGTWRNLKRSVWNHEKRLFLDRSCEGWAQIGLFYVVFYGVLFSLFALKMWILLMYLYSKKEPLVSRSLIGRSSNDAGNRMMPLLARTANEGPGMSFQPNILTPITSPIIWISETSGKAKPIRYVRALDEFFQRYSEEKLRHTTKCQYGDAMISVGVNEPCFFNISTLGKCSKPPYGYTTGEPCVIIAFNKMFHWVPNCYSATSDLPSAMPDSLKKLVRQSTEPNIWFSCAGSNPVDREHLGEIEYIPKTGFPVDFFPYFGHSHHMSPLVALQFKNLSVNRLLTVECTAWARNINVRDGYSLEFQIMIGK